jgi:hypothetical protein
MRTPILVAVTLCVCASAGAQVPVPGAASPSAPAISIDTESATISAISAFVRGDYARAAELLQPLVDNWTSDVSPAVAFFLAALYESGLGVPHDPSRACALYARSEAGDGPLAAIGRQLAQARMSELGSDLSAECIMLANVGINHGFVPARFTLDADHWVAIDLDSKKHNVVATVSYQGKENSQPLQTQLSNGAVFLPIGYTMLETGRPSPARRHFIEVLVWLPQSGSHWALTWTLTEITNGDATHVASEILTTFEGGPPLDLLLDLRDLVALRVNDSGSAEFEILDGPDARREGIPTLAERRETASEGMRRKAAAEKVDWKRRRDPARPPSLSYADADGCGDLLVHAWSADHTETLAIRADRNLLQLTTSPRIFDLATMPADFEVVADVYDRAQGQRFCTDAIVIPEGTRQETWRAVGGTVSVQLSEPGVRARNPQQYRTTIQIDNAEFLGPDGTTVRAPRPIRLSAIAGQPDYVEEPALLTGVP